MQPYAAKRRRRCFTG